SVALSSCSLPANRCFSPTRDSKTNRSAARRARLNERREAEEAGQRKRGQKPRRHARNAEKRPRFLSDRRRGARCFAGNASKQEGPWARRKHTLTIETEVEGHRS